jgi:hypothetical protein
MLKVRSMTFAVALGLALLVDSDAFSQRRAPQVNPPQPNPSQTTQNPQPDQRGTENAPFIVKVLPPPNGEQKASGDAKREQDKADSDVQIALFTERLFWATVALAIIAFLQLCVFGWQGVQLKRTVRATNESAGGLINAERARVGGGPWPQSIVTLPNGITRFQMAMMNNGRTAAIVKELAVKTSDIEPTSRTRDYAGAVIKRYDHYLKPDQPWIDLHFLIDHAGTASFHCFGYIKYIDVFGQSLTGRFCTSVDPQTQRLETSGHPIWNEDD